MMARTLSDLTSQNISVTDTQLTNIFNASTGIMTPYSATPMKSTITELYVDPTTKVARVQWSKGDAPRGAGSTVAIPTALQVGGTYLIYSEVSYKYVPSIGYVMTKTGIDMSDFTYTRPRQSTCVMYNTAVCTRLNLISSREATIAARQNEKGRTMGAAFRYFEATFQGAPFVLKNRLSGGAQIVGRRFARAAIGHDFVGDLLAFTQAFQGRHVRQR